MLMDKRVKSVRRMAQGGLYTVYEIAVEFGVSEATVLAWTRDIVTRMETLLREPSQPCSYPAGSPERVEAYAERVERGERIWCAQDARDTYNALVARDPPPSLRELMQVPVVVDYRKSLD